MTVRLFTFLFFLAPQASLCIKVIQSKEKSSDGRAKIRDVELQVIYRHWLESDIHLENDPLDSQGVQPVSQIPDSRIQSGEVRFQPDLCQRVVPGHPGASPLLDSHRLWLLLLWLHGCKERGCRWYVGTWQGVRSGDDVGLGGEGIRCFLQLLDSWGLELLLYPG